MENIHVNQEIKTFQCKINFPTGSLGNIFAGIVNFVY